MPRLSLAITDLAPPAGGTLLPRLPALERLLSRGDRGAGPADFRRWILARAGIDAPARLALAEVVAGRPGAWALATPVHLVAGLERVHLHPAGVPALAPGELDAVAASVNRQLGGDGLALEAVTPTLGLLALPRPVEAETHDPALLAGREAGAWLPAGADGGWLRRLMTEIQMLLHEHPVNAGRAARGEAAMNGLWLWGVGGDALPALPATLPALATTDACLAALWRRADTKVAAPPAAADALLDVGAGEGHVVTLELGALAASPVDALGEMEERWFAPLERALARGRLEGVDLWLGGWTVACAPRDRLRFWRRGAPWHEALT
jgi:hypothetical protein